MGAAKTMKNEKEDDQSIGKDADIDPYTPLGVASDDDERIAMFIKIAMIFIMCNIALTLIVGIIVIMVMMR